MNALYSAACSIAKMSNFISPRYTKLLLITYPGIREIGE